MPRTQVPSYLAWRASSVYSGSGVEIGRGARTPPPTRNTPPPIPPPRPSPMPGPVPLPTPPPRSGSNSSAGAGTVRGGCARHCRNRRVPEVGQLGGRDLDLRRSYHRRFDGKLRFFVSDHHRRWGYLLHTDFRQSPSWSGQFVAISSPPPPLASCTAGGSM
jgi:hypothetical protein